MEDAANSVSQVDPDLHEVWRESRQSSMSGPERQGQAHWLRKCCNNPTGNPVLSPPTRLSDVERKKVSKKSAIVFVLFCQLFMFKDNAKRVLNCAVEGSEPCCSTTHYITVPTPVFPS